jgi:predicted transcriptional regulator
MAVEHWAPLDYYGRRSMIYYNCHRMQAMAGKRSVDEPGRRAFGELEQQVLSVLWSSDRPLIPREVQEKLGDPPAYTTVMTILDRLQRKGVATRSNKGRAFAYEAVVSESAVAAEHARALLANGHDRRAVLQGFVDVLSEDDSDELQRLLRQAQQGRRSRRGPG